MRLDDYLDDKLQYAADLDNLDDLLASVEEQRLQLQSQLDDASKSLQSARQSADERQASLQQQIDDFQALQQDIDLRLQIVAASDAPDEAIQRLEAPMRRLAKVDLAHKYLVLLQDVEDLRIEARSHLPKSPKAALEPYTKLKRLAAYLQELQVEADGAAVHLVTHVAAIADSLWEEMKKTMWTEMDGILAKKGWPKKVDPQSEVDDEWREGFEKSIDLQVPEILYSTQVITLLPMEVMAQNWVKEFRYHFMSDKETSNPRNIGSQCFPWVLTQLEEWDDFLRDNFGYILATRFADTAVADKMVYMDPTCALITSLLPVLREKVQHAMDVALQDPAFLSSLMGQLMTFDDDLRKRFNYDGGDVEKGWGGITSEVLDKHFDIWLKAERTFALERYQVIMSNPEARQIDYDYSGPGKTKPTYGAIRMIDLLRSVTSQYDRVKRFSHQLRFLIDIQLAILDQYHHRLRDGLDAYNASTSLAFKAISGASKEDLAALEGTGAFETLCKVFGSSDHVVSALKEWSNEEIFVEMWERLQARARGGEDQANLAGGMSHEQVKDRTSQSMGLTGDGGILFDETIKAYIARRQQAEDWLVAAVQDSHAKAFRPYIQRVQWTTISEDGGPIDPYALAITAELDEPLRILKRNLDFLSHALSTAVLRRLLRRVLASLQDNLYENVLAANRFTTLGAAQFLRDVHAVLSLVDRYVPDASAAMAFLADAVRLLNLPVDIGGSGDEFAGWDMEDEEDGEGGEKDGGDEAGEVAGEKRGELSLKRVSDRIFVDNTEARKVLEELGLEMLEPQHARRIVQNRVENSD
ncbi:RINT-1 family protein [Coniella lustricola]|uniref:RINT-1 family protein n=1 Tax=Coniella lustricola TaxID=2025994 RepID=A0A2T3ACE2_9PEZI|nr:RINT-1 family protein [Coniella lustricola]